MTTTELTFRISCDDEDALERRRVAWNMDTKEQVLQALVDSTVEDGMVEYDDEFGVSISAESPFVFPDFNAFEENQSPEEIGDIS